MTDDEFTPNCDEGEWWNEESFFWVSDQFIEEETARLHVAGGSRESLINELAELRYKNFKLWAQIEHNAQLFDKIEELLEESKGVIENAITMREDVIKLQDVVIAIHKALHEPLRQLGARDAVKRLNKEKAAHAADVRHSKPGGAREKQEAIRAIWASGKYTSRDICAEEECAGLGMSFSAARKALKNTAKPT